MIEESGFSEKEFAKQLDISYDWVRKACSVGIVRIHPQNEQSLGAICRFFHIKKTDYLWKELIHGSNSLTKDGLSESSRVLVDDLNWLLNHFPADHNVAEVKRVISETANHLRQLEGSPLEPFSDVKAKGTRLRSPLSAAVRFKSNIRHLVSTTGMTQKLLSTRLKVPYAWLRKVCTFGLHRPRPQNEKFLHAICEFFRLKNVESLWKSGLIAKSVVSEDDGEFENYRINADLVWLLRYVGNHSDVRSRASLKEVMRVINAVTKHLFVPTNKPILPIPKAKRPERSEAEISRDVLKLLDSFRNSSPKTIVPQTPHRDLRLFVNKSKEEYSIDEDDLLDQIDADLKKASGKKASYQVDVPAKNREFQPTPEQILNATQKVVAFHESLPETIKSYVSIESLDWLVFQTISDGDAIEQCRNALLAVEREILLESRVHDFIRGLPQSLRKAFAKEKEGDEFEIELLQIVTLKFGEDVSPLKVRCLLEKLAELRGFVAEPESLKQRRRIRRRPIRRNRTRHESLPAAAVTGSSRNFDLDRAAKNSLPSG